MKPGKNSDRATPEMLQEFRAEFGLTQANLRDLIDVTWQTLSRWERGVQPIRHPRLLYLALQQLRRQLRRQPGSRRARTDA